MSSGVAKIAEQARRILGRRDADADIDQRELELCVKQALSKLVRNRAFETKADDYMQIPESLIVTYKNVAIQKDTDTGELFSVLPARVLDLPYGVGIKLITAPKSFKCGFYRAPNGFDSMSCDLESNCIPGKAYYYHSGDRIYFSNLEHENRPDDVLIRLVAPAEDVPTENLQIPGDMEMDVLTQTVEIYNTFRPQDEINDSVDLI